MHALLPRAASRLRVAGVGFALSLMTIATAVPSGAQAPDQNTASAKSMPLTTAAAEKMFASYEGQNVESIGIAGRPDLKTSDFEPQFTQKAGEPFSKAKVDATAKAIQASGHFKAVRIQVKPASTGVRVRLILEPAIYIGIYEFPGAGHFAYSRLIQVTNYPVQTAYDAAEVERARKSLLRFFQQQGYFQATITTQTQVDAPHAVANVIFTTHLGKHAKFGRVEIAGVPPAEQQELREEIHGVIARIRLSAVRPGKAYHRSTLTHATNYMQGKLIKQNLLSAQVKLSGAHYNAETNRADIHFDINPGPKIKVDVTGAHLWSWDRKKLLPMYQGVGVDQETVQEGRRALASYFQKKGYFDVKVDAQLKTGPNGDQVLYEIAKNKKHSVEDINVTGNHDIKSDTLLSHVAVQKEHFLSHGQFSEQLVHTSVKNLKAVYQSEGFSGAQVVPAVKRKGGNIYVTFAVTEGTRDVVNSLTILGANTFPPSQYAPHGLRVVKGQPYSAARVAADRNEIVANYLKAGYLTSTFRETASVVSKGEPHLINVVYHVYEGPRVLTGDVITLGRKHTRQTLLSGDIADLKPEKPLTETALLSAGTKLYDHTNVFDWAEVDPKRPITTQTIEDVLVKVHEAQRNRITYGFGFEVINRGGSIPTGTVALPNLPPVGLPSNFKTSQTTFYGPRGTFEYTRNNVRGKAETLSFTAFAGRLNQRFAAYYLDPTFRWTPWKTTTSISYERNEENPIYSSQQELATVQIQRAIDKTLSDTVFLRYGFSHTNLTRVLIPSLVLPADRNVRLSTLSANFTRDTRDNPLDEHSGVLDSLELDFNTTKLGSSVDFAKLTGQAAFYKTKFHNIVWADSLRIGLAQPFANSRVPLSETFFTGGANSLRGFPLDGAGPQRAVEVCPNGGSGCNQFIHVPAGGNELLIINSEARIPLPIKKGLSIVPFYDGGNVFPNVGFHDFTSLYSNNVGIGVRYATPVGPIRLDVGHNLNPIPGVKATQWFISIGQAF